MDVERFLEALLERSPPHVLEHLQLVLLALGAATLVSFTLGVTVTRPGWKHWQEWAMVFLNIGQTLPPLAVIALFLPFLGLGFQPAVLALTIYALLPIARSTVAGLVGVSTGVKGAARGMGMNSRQLFWQVELPLALPVLLAGLRTSAVVTTGTATLAALVGGGGLGRVVFAGIDMFWPEFIVGGTLLVALIALLLDRAVVLLELFLVPRHLRQGG